MKDNKQLTTMHIHNGGQSAINKLNMNKLDGSAILNRSAENPATVHVRGRWASLRRAEKCQVN